ncbi:hypothetical protein GQR36_14635 [Enterococcus termitis]
MLINPGSAEINNNEIIINHKSLDVTVLKQAFTVNTVKQFSSTEYSKLLPGEEITSTSEDYPDITIEDNQIRVKNKKMKR